MTAGAPRTEPVSPLRVLALLLVVDLGIGLWLKLHRPDALPLFLIVNAPTVGVTGFFWPLLPKDTQDRLGLALAGLLETPRTVRTLLVLGGGLFLTSLWFASVTVELLDASVSTDIRVVRGSQTEADTQAVHDATRFRLNRLTTPHSEVLTVAPIGQRVWIYSPTHVLFRDTTLFPWLPVRVQYPADFAPMANVAVLPSAAIISRVRRGDLVLRLREHGNGTLLATTRLDTAGIVVGFVRPAGIAPADSARWHEMLAYTNDPEFIALMLRWWLIGSWTPASRPLRQGDTLSWDVHSDTDTLRTVARGTLVLNAPLADLHLQF